LIFSIVSATPAQHANWPEEHYSPDALGKYAHTFQLLRVKIAFNRETLTINQHCNS